jgi:hypothetical protein
MIEYTICISCMCSFTMYYCYLFKRRKAIKRVFNYVVLDQKSVIKEGANMAQYVVCSSHMKASKVKGNLPDIIYEYIANDSMIPWHYTFTRNIKDAYYFDDFAKAEAKEIAHLWNMKVNKLDA